LQVSPPPRAAPRSADGLQAKVTAPVPVAACSLQAPALPLRCCANAPSLTNAEYLYRAHLKDLFLPAYLKPYEPVQ